MEPDSQPNTQPKPQQPISTPRPEQTTPSADAIAQGKDKLSPAQSLTDNTITETRPTASAPANNIATEPQSAPAAQGNQPFISTASKPTAKPANKTTAKIINQWQFWAMIGAGIFGLIGIVLGIYGISAKVTAEQEVARLQTELDTANDLVIKYMTQLGEKVNELNRPGNVEDGKENLDDLLNGLASATKDYIYIGEWGIKIKIPEGLKNVSYEFDNILAPEEAEYYASDNIELLRISGILKEMKSTPEALRFDRDYSGSGIVARRKKDQGDFEGGSAPIKILELGDYNYYYSHPQMLSSEDPAEQENETKIINLIETMLTTPENFSTFKNN